MEPFLVILAGFAVSLFGIALKSGHRPARPRTRAADWLAAAEACGLNGVATAFDGRERRLHARRGNLTVSLSASVFLKSSGTKVRLEGIVPWLEVSGRPEGLRLLGGTRGLKLGDQGAGQVPAIVRVLESEVAPRAAAAARALGSTGASQAAPALVRALAHADAAVREASAVSLGRVGATTDDVLALRQAEAAHAWDGTFLRAVREAITSIRSRFVGAEQGQLALAEPSGELSLAADDAGRLSPPSKLD